MEQASLQLRLPAQVDLEGGTVVARSKVGDGDAEEAARFKDCSAGSQGWKSGFPARQEVL